MEKRKKMTKFLKNRLWKSKIANRLKGRVEDICQDYLCGAIDRDNPIHVSNDKKSGQKRFWISRTEV